MAQIVLLGLEPEQTGKEASEVLQRDCADFLSGPFRIVTTPARAEQGRTLGSLLGKPTCEDSAWETQFPLKDLKLALNRLLQPLLQNQTRAVVIVTSTVLQKLASVYDSRSDSANLWAVMYVFTSSNVILRAKSEVFPQFRLQAALKAIKTQVLDKARGWKSASSKPLSGKAPPKAIAELNKSLDEFRERMVTAIDRSQTQAEERLKKLENSLWKKAQDKLQKLDDCHQSVQPLNSDLETLKTALETPSRHTALRRKIDDLRSLLERCQSDLQELERTRNTYEEDQYGKSLPLHLLKEVTVTDSVLQLRVVNLKGGRFENIQLEVKDESGQVEVRTMTVLSGLQTVRLRLNRDLYSVSEVGMVFKRADQELSNRLVLELQDAPQSESIKVVRRPLDEVLPPALPKRFQPPINFFESSQSIPFPVSALPEYSPFHSLHPHSLPLEMNSREQEMFTVLEGFWGAEFMQKEREHFLGILRGPGGASLDVQEVGDMMSRKLSK